MASSPPPVPAPPGPTLTSRVTQVGLGLVVLHLGFRAWASLNSWFYLDDYKLLFDAHTQGMSIDYVLLPYNNNLMAGGRIVAWLVDVAGPLQWEVASASLLAMQAIAALGALWACLTLFGRRWAALVPLTLYLASAMALPVMMWWTAGLNQVPLQGAFFLALGSWVHYLRTRRMHWLAATLLAIAYGLLFYVKAILIFPVLAFIALAYFAEGGPINRVVSVVRRFWPAATLGVAMAVAYVGYYVTHVTSPFTETSPSVIAEIADTMILRAFGSAVVGGPWQWNTQPAPNSFADPPLWAVAVGWVVILAVIAIGALTRRRTLRTWVLMGGFLLACLALLVNSRGPAFGAISGLEYRYLTDAACLAAICVGLVFLDVPGAVQSSESRPRPRVTLPTVPGLVPGLTALVAVSGMASSFQYAHTWHTDNASDAYLHTLSAELARTGRVDLVEQAVPNAVYTGIFAPDNDLSRMTTLLDNQVDYPTTSERLATVDDDGRLHEVVIAGGLSSLPGPRKDCGWLVRGPEAVDIPLESATIDFLWWTRIAYLASASSPVTVAAGDSVQQTSVRSGLNYLYVRADGAYDSVRIEGLDAGVTVCIDEILVGNAAAGGQL